MGGSPPLQAWVRWRAKSATHCTPCPTTARFPGIGVVNARGEISRRSVPGAEFEQRVRLELEGVTFDARGRVRLKQFAWTAAVR